MAADFAVVLAGAFASVTISGEALAAGFFAAGLAAAGITGADFDAAALLPPADLAEADLAATGVRVAAFVVSAFEVAAFGDAALAAVGLAGVVFAAVGFAEVVLELADFTVAGLDTALRGVVLRRVAGFAAAFGAGFFAAPSLVSSVICVTPILSDLPPMSFPEGPARWEILQTAKRTYCAFRMVWLVSAGISSLLEIAHFWKDD